MMSMLFMTATCHFLSNKRYIRWDTQHKHVVSCLFAKHMSSDIFLSVQPRCEYVLVYVIRRWEMPGVGDMSL